MKKNIPIYAHRGASAHAIENSFLAFTKAIDLGADGIEMDLQCSSDGELFVFHDLNLIRLVGIERFINECSAEELRGYRLGGNFLRRFSKSKIPSFQQFLEWLQEHQMPVNIELKESLLKRPDILQQAFANLQLAKGSHFSSFHEELLIKVKEIRPDLETALIVTKKFDWNELGQKTHLDAVHANKKYYKRRFLKACEAANKPVRFYAIDGTEEFLRCPHPVVAGWITDYPERVAKVQNR